MDRNIIDDLKSKSMSFTLGEIEEMMNEELSKAPEEMDTELIDICADILDKAYSGKEEKIEPQKKRIKLDLKKIISLVAAFAIIITGTTLGVHQFNSRKITEDSALDFEIVAYANENVKNGVTISNDEIDLIDYNIKLFVDFDGQNAVSSQDNSAGFCINAENIESVTFKSEIGEFWYYDSLRRNMLEREKKYYIEIPLTDSENELYLNKFDGKTSDFLEYLMTIKDCSPYFSGNPDDYAVFYSPVGDYENENQLLLVSDKLMSELSIGGTQITAKTYSDGDVIENVTYDAEMAVNYLLKHPDTPLDELPQDTITITVKFKSGDTATKKILAKFNSEGVLTLKYI